MGSESELFICIDKDNVVWSVIFDEKRDEERDTFSLSGEGYSDCILGEDGEDAAREVIARADYWIDMGYIDKGLPDVIRNNIDWDAVADDVIGSDGWESIQAEYQSFGEYDDKEYFFNNVCGGQSFDWKKGKVKRWLIPRKDAKRVLYLWKHFHLLEEKNPTKPQPKTARKEMMMIIERNKKMCDRKNVLKIYMEAEDE